MSGSMLKLFSNYCHNPKDLFGHTIPICVVKTKSRSMPYAVPATPWVSHTPGNLNLIITVTININILFIILSIILFIITYNALTCLQLNLKAGSQYNQDTTRLDHPQSLFYFMPQPSRIQLNSLKTQSNLVAIQFHKRQNCRTD